ncbi:MAG TPA: hypothetical protein VMZ73_10450 [Acidimicrobiales bacterium]|nr:hypothetical protein [Acidimicrobiales bacterium]
MPSNHSSKIPHLDHPPAARSRRGRRGDWELARYDEFLVLAAHMLEMPVPDTDESALAPEVRAQLEERLSQAGIDVWGLRVIREGRLS